MIRRLIHKSTYILLILTLAVMVGSSAAWLFWQIAVEQTFNVTSIFLLILVLLFGVFLWLLTQENPQKNPLQTALRLAQRYTRKDQAWREALQAQALYEYYFRGAPIGILALDEKAIIKSCNPMLRKMTGKPEKACIGASVHSLFDDADAEAISAAIAAASRESTYHSTEARLSTPDSKTVALYVGRLEGERAEDQRLVLYMLDISGRKELEQQFAQSQKMQAIGQLAGGIAHDFNNLLTAIIGHCDLMLERHPVGDPSYVDIDQIRRNADRASGLVKHLLAYSRQQKLQPQVLDITETLADLSHLLKRWITEAVTLDVVHGRDLGKVKMDKTQLEQVLMNLAINARDAMPQGGRLTITTYNYHQVRKVRRGTETFQPGDYVTLEVSDTGTGIPPEVLERIFEPFFTTKAVGSGTGLGLSTVYGIVKQTGGYVFVESAMGKGTTFLIHLPRHVIATDQQPVIAATSATTTPPMASDLNGNATILLVEDEDPVRLFGARALRNKGYTVIEARNGEAALDMLNGKNPPAFDLLVTDVMMPGVDGPTLIRTIRDRLPDTRVICISGYAEESIREKLNSLENIEFLPKPFTLQQLASRVKAVLEGS